jgi:hypothetical protein
MTEYFKVLKNGRGTYSNAAWSLPTDDQPGAWMEVAGPLIMCANGLHVTDWQGVWQHWMRWGADVYRVEIDGDTIGDVEAEDRKIAARRARLLSVVSVADLPSWWIAVRTFVLELPTYKWLKPDGNPDPSWKIYPTRDAVWDAAGAAARDAAGDAVWDAAWAAARAAVWDAARAAARAAAGDAARDVAGDVAGAAVRDAAGAAVWDAARAAVWDAAWAAAWAAVRDAAGDAALTTRCLIASDLIDPKHLDHATARMNVWKKGYGLFCDVGGVLYVYERIA